MKLYDGASIAPGAARANGRGVRQLPMALFVRRDVRMKARLRVVLVS